MIYTFSNMKAELNDVIKKNSDFKSKQTRRAVNVKQI